MLDGASEDNLFQVPLLQQGHLELLKHSGKY